MRASAARSSGSSSSSVHSPALAPRRRGCAPPRRATVAAAAPAPTRGEHNQLQNAVFGRDDVVREFTAPLPPEIEARLAAIVAAVPGLGAASRVIDAGCGAGALIPHLRARGVADVVAADLSPAMLAALAARFPPPGPCGNDFGVRAWRGDFVDLPVYMGSADAIFLNAMFGNVHDQVCGGAVCVCVCVFVGTPLGEMRRSCHWRRRPWHRG